MQQEWRHFTTSWWPRLSRVQPGVHSDLAMFAHLVIFQLDLDELTENRLVSLKSIGQFWNKILTKLTGCPSLFLVGNVWTRDCTHFRTLWPTLQPTVNKLYQVRTEYFVMNSGKGFQLLVLWGSSWISRASGQSTWDSWPIWTSWPACPEAWLYENSLKSWKVG